ncbi:DNA-3-methyladenine glycosylase family protein [Acidaminobacter sp.]|uniref:DNA-3-methyladenine glycosylase family protein n=1 Tax=Acidaminobacter sp. TaxID=1872102 RepID=UPI001383D2E1|nr:DNA-3-methyladenine glycosylase 2 family protein [Acidaminobacter sp.]MDK9712064.1 DNA-3-methyladenine glycosylase 2 family protein [Acidaminobacter sp.]MZQ97588.1 DNA-3-methyladenine glycosylase 2 family protein [Acidaminobacter sp.]
MTPTNSKAIPPNNPQFLPYPDHALEHLTARDPALGLAIQHFGRLERPVAPDPFTALASAITGQLISTKAYDAIWARLKKELQTVTPQTVYAAGPEALRACGLTRNKAAAIHQAAAAILSSAFDLNAAATMDDEAAIHHLSSLKGIGRWSSEITLIHGFLRLNILSYGDAAIRRGMCNLYGVPTIGKDFFETCKAAYSPYGSVASIYLWKSAFIEII